MPDMTAGTWYHVTSCKHLSLACSIVAVNANKAFMLVQIVARSSEDTIVDASVDSVHQQPHARFCTTLGEGENRYISASDLLWQH